MPERLAQLEAVIERGQATFIEVGRALAEIREQQLYRATARTFEQYCKRRWGWGAGRARQLTVAAKYATKLRSATTGSASAPRTERQAREQMRDLDLDAELLDALSPEELNRRLEQAQRLKEERRQAQSARQVVSEGRGQRLERILLKLKSLERDIAGLGDELAEVPLRHLEALRQSLAEAA